MTQRGPREETRRGDTGRSLTVQTGTEHALRARHLCVCHMETGVTERWPAPCRDRGDRGPAARSHCGGRLLVPGPGWRAKVKAAWTPPTCSGFRPRPHPSGWSRGCEVPSPLGTPSRSFGIHSGTCARDGPSPQSAADAGILLEASPTSLFNNFPQTRCSLSLLGPGASYASDRSSGEGLRRRDSGAEGARGFCVGRGLLQLCRVWHLEGDGFANGSEAAQLRDAARRRLSGRRLSGSGGGGGSGPAGLPCGEVARRHSLAPSTPGQVLGAHSVCFSQGDFSLDAAEEVGQATSAHHPCRRHHPGVIPASCNCCQFH